MTAEFGHPGQTGLAHGFAASPTIDVHSHFFPETWPDLAARFGGDWPWMRRDSADTATVMMGTKEFRPITSACWDRDVRLADMDADGIDGQIVSATPVLFAYKRPAEQALECAHIFNDALLEITEGSNGRLIPFCQVPLQDTDAACKELERSIAAGHRGVQIGNHVGDRDLDDAGIITFLEHCASLDVPVFVHPWDMFGGCRLDDWMLEWTVSMAAETQLSLNRLILGGGFDRLPRNLRICFAHGGGSFPYMLGRLENAWNRRDIARGISAAPPSYYLDRFNVDSAVFDTRALQFLVDVMSPERVLLGSDYPFPLGEERVGSLIRSSGLPDASVAALLGGNAATFLGGNIAACCGPHTPRNQA
jgi:aminocarboxymuconate-semialdehyde decarboxylase